MNRFLILLLGLFGFCIGFAQNGQGSNRIVSHFIGSTPCSAPSRPLPGIPLNVDCELIQWDLSLFENTATKTASAFVLRYSFGMSQPNTHGIMGGGTQRELHGNWTRLKGSSNPRSNLIRLQDTETGVVISFWEVSERLLHLLDADGHLMVGNAGWSYTLNKTELSK